MSTTRKRRTLEERIADEKAKLAELETKLNIKKIEEAADEGQVSEENQAEFKSLKRELASVKKVIKAADRHDATAVSEALSQFQSDLTAAMAELVNHDDD